MHKINFHAADALMKKITGKTVPFGGILLVTCGDFKQIPPIVERGGKSETITASVKHSPLWKNFEVFHLTQPMRQINDPECSRYLIFKTFNNS